MRRTHDAPTGSRRRSASPRHPTSSGSDSTERDEEGRWLLPAFEGPGTSSRSSPVPGCTCARSPSRALGSEIVIVLEHEASGTQGDGGSQSGFPAWFAFATDAFAIGWRHIVADLALYLDRRSARRTSCAFVGDARMLAPRDDAGPRSRRGHGRRRSPRSSGSSPGDVVLTVGAAPIVTRAELETMMRISGWRPTIEVEWAHGDERLAATATL